MTSEFSAAEDKLMEGGRSSDQEEEDEALSLSDLPLNIEDNSHVDENQSGDEPRCRVKEAEDQEFNFGSWGGSLSTESEMCAADDVFFKGQILPLRFSVSSESGLIQHELRRNSATSCLSRSESMDHLSSVDRLTSVNSSRSSSSSRSHKSSSTTTTSTTKNSNPRIIRNQFHTYPSPKPQIRLFTSRLQRSTSSNRTTQKSTVWNFFRLGLVRTPEIELQGLKVRNKICVSRNSSSGSSSSSINNYNNRQELKIMGKKHNKKQNLLDKKMGLFSGCKCSITAVETVPLNNIVIIKSDSEGNRINNGESIMSGMEKKLQELKIKQKRKQKQQGKQAMSRHRTFEWLRELSHASYVDGET